MLNLKKSLTALVGLLALVITLVSLVPLVIRGQGNSGNAPPTQNVNVVNTPLPVTGSVSVSNLGDSPLPVRDVDNAAKQPVHASANCRSTDFRFCDATFFTVPAGKRLVIENISMEARLPAGLAATMQVSGGGWLPLSPPSVDFGVGTGSLTRQNELVRFYLNPGAPVSIQVHRTGGIASLEANYDFQISGYFVDIQ